MKKLILIVTLLLSSINVSADLTDRIADYATDRRDFLISSSSVQERQDQAQ